MVLFIAPGLAPGAGGRDVKKTKEIHSPAVAVMNRPTWREVLRFVNPYPECWKVEERVRVLLLEYAGRPDRIALVRAARSEYRKQFGLE